MKKPQPKIAVLFSRISSFASFPTVMTILFIPTIWLSLTTIALGETEKEKTSPVIIAQNNTETETQRLLEEGWQLFIQGSAESLRQAIDKWEIALPLSRVIGDKSEEAFMNLALGSAYSSLGEKQKALNYYNQALSLYGEMGYRNGEATTLNNIGLVYSILGEKQLALNYYSKALPIIKEVGDRSGEATTLSNIGLVYSNLGEKQKALTYYNQA